MVNRVTKTVYGLFYVAGSSVNIRPDSAGLYWLKTLTVRLFRQPPPQRAPKTNRSPPRPLTFLSLSPQASPSLTGPISRSLALAPGRSSCGISSWSCCRKRSTMGWLPGRETMANLWSKTRMKWRGCGAFGNASLTWTTTS